LRRRPKSRDSRGERRSQSTKQLPSVSETKNSSSTDKNSEDNEGSNKDNRTKYCDSAAQNPKSEKDVSNEAHKASSKGSRGSDSDCSSNTEDELVNADVLMFGKNFEKQPLEGSIELSSDQDSTGGEEDEFIGNYSIKLTFLHIICIYINLSCSGSQRMRVSNVAV
jgi:Arf-GAP/coiled-coil/ANK repeat/PH domain-containing protein